MRVYRVETEDGIGAYNIYDDDYGDYYLRGTVNLDIHPRPADDPALEDVRCFDERWGCEPEDVLFGFSSIEDYKNWFTEYMLEVLRPHAKLSVYEACEYVCGKGQMVFNFDTATLIERREL